MSIYQYPVVNILGATGPTGPTGGFGPAGPASMVTGPTGPRGTIGNLLTDATYGTEFYPGVPSPWVGLWSDEVDGRVGTGIRINNIPYDNILADSMAFFNKGSAVPVVVIRPDGGLSLNTTSSYLDIAPGNLDGPSFNELSSGVKLSLYDDVSATKAGFNIGMEENGMWFGTSQQSSNANPTHFTWYAGLTPLMILNDSNNLTVYGSTVVTGNITAAGAKISGVNYPSSAGSADYILTTDGSSQATWQLPVTGLISSGPGISVSYGLDNRVGIDNTGILSITGTPNQVISSNVGGNVTLSLPQSIATTSSPTFANMTVGNLTVTGNLTTVAVTNLAVTSKTIHLAVGSTTPAQANGGGIFLEGANATILYSSVNNQWGFNTDINSGNVNTGNVLSNYGNFTNSVHVGLNPTSTFLNSLIQVTGSENGYQQINNQNLNSGSAVSSDFIATANNGNDSAYYVDVGINGSTYNNIAYTVGGPNDGYIYVNGGNISIGTQTGNSIIFHTQGTLSTNIVGRVNDHRWILNGVDDGSSILQVTGNSSVYGELLVTGNAFINGEPVVTQNQITPNYVLPTRIIAAPSATLSSTDYYVGINYNGNVSLTLPAGSNGHSLVVKDESGDAKINPIIINPQLGDKVEGVIDGNITLSIGYGSITFIYRTGWWII